MSLIRFVHMVRMEEAKNLLVTTFLSVKQIMAEVGLRDKSHFVRDFKMTMVCPQLGLEHTF